MEKIVVRTERAIHSEVFYDIVYEWEDELCKVFNSKLFYARNYIYHGTDVARSLLYRFHMNIEDLRLLGKTAFAYDMFGHTNKDLIHSCHTAICIIDFYPREDMLHAFYQAHKDTPFLFLSNKEVYDFLMDHQPERKIYHLPLSLPDKYRINEKTTFKKNYDLVLAGRQNTKLLGWLDLYCKSHKISYIYRKKADLTNNEFPYYTNEGQFDCNVVTREDYFNLLRQSKIAFYSTPGLEDAKKDITNGFSQVTPRFLELLSCGCLLLGCYPDNADTRYYHLDDFVINVSSYEQFESTMDKLLKQEVNIKKYSSYLENHYTSVIAKKLLNIILPK